MITREAWYRELLSAGPSSSVRAEGGGWAETLVKKKSDTAISAPDPAERCDDKEQSHLPGEREMPPEPFRKHPKKLV